jgi:hypothetical protein
MQSAKSASVRVLAPIGVALLAVAVLVVVATSLGGGSNGDGNGGRAGGGQKKERSGEKFYVVEPGDTLTTISRKTDVGVDKLTRLNPDLDPQALISGQRVKLR